MKFGTTLIPERLFELARLRLLNNATSTPEDVRQHLLKQGAAELAQTNSIPRNHRLIAERVFQAVREDLVAKGKLKQLKRGVWATTTFLNLAA